MKKSILLSLALVLGCTAEGPLEGQEYEALLAGEGWSYCARERSHCAFPTEGEWEVAFGIDDQWTVEVHQGSGVHCGTSSFEIDPARGVLKACYVREASLNATDALGSGCAEDACDESAGWSYCSPERTNCSFEGRRVVAYGARDSWVYAEHSDGVHCGNLVFGDPLPGIGKHCWTRAPDPVPEEPEPGDPEPMDPEPVDPEDEVSPCADDECPSADGWRFCSRERSDCSFEGEHEVAYGAADSWVYETHVDGVFCGNSVFGDPLRGVEKACWVRDRDAGEPIDPIDPIDPIEPIEETADVRASFTSNRTDSGFPSAFDWGGGINCGDRSQDGLDSADSSDLRWQSHSGNSQIFFNDRLRQRFSCLPTARMRTDASIEARCNQNFSVERAEIGASSALRDAGAAIGQTIWMGWSQLYTELDDDHSITDLQIRSRCGSGSPRTEFTLRPPGHRHAGLEMRSGGGTRVLIPRDRVRQDVWYDFVIAVHLATDATGSVRVWVREAGDTDAPVRLDYDDPAVEMEGVVTAFDTCPHLRWGVYRWQSGDYRPSAIDEDDYIHEKVVSQVRFRFGRDLGRRGFDAVVPRDVCE